jgi:hypothetical protein
MIIFFKKIRKFLLVRIFYNISERIFNIRVDFYSLIIGAFPVLLNKEIFHLIHHLIMIFDGNLVYYVSPKFN